MECLDPDVPLQLSVSYRSAIENGKLLIFLMSPGDDEGAKCRLIIIPALIIPLQGLPISFLSQ